MDIYSFINSKDIEAYCREINKTWNPFDMAVIIGISHRTKKEKHAAWRELIAEYPDMPTPKGYHHESYPSLHQKLKEVIEFEQIYETNAFAMFKKSEQGAVYTYGINGDGYYDTVFTTFDLAFADMTCTFERKEVKGIKMRRSYLDDTDNEKGSMIAYLDYDGNLLDINISASEDLRSLLFPNVNYDSSRMFSNDFYVIIPTPFKRGDILYNPNSLSVGMGKDELLFVLDSIDHDNPRIMERRLRYEGDITDMAAISFFVGYNGVLTQDPIIPYDNIEYYRGKLEGKNQLLQYVSWYLKDEIALPALLSMQCKMMLQSLADDGIDVYQWAYPKDHIIAETQVNHEKTLPF